MQSYLIGLWFSLRTHASQIWQNPRQVMHPLDIPSNRISLYQKLLPQKRGPGSLRRKSSNLSAHVPSRSETPIPRNHDLSASETSARSNQLAPASSPNVQRRVSYAVPPVQAPPGFTPLLESVDHAIKDTAIQPMQLPPNMTTDDFTRAVAVATVSALRHQQHTLPGARARVSGAEAEEGGGHGGHDAPSWSRATSASVLLACTALYAIIAGMCIWISPISPS
jgi:Ca2+:H+ antiporter